MLNSYLKLLNGNKLWALKNLQEDAAYFTKHEGTQTPEYLWIGCSDSRVPANQITSTSSGDIFVHRNVANLALSTDLNMLSVVAYAVQHLKVKHIIVCGHYGCGGVNAAMDDKSYGFVDQWLKYIKDVYVSHRSELDLIQDQTLKSNRLVELNVLAQVVNLSHTEIVKAGLDAGTLSVHAWVYGLHDGIITDLNAIEGK